MYYHRTTPSIAMPIEQGTTNVLAQVDENNRGLYASVTDVRTSNASNLVGQTFHVNRLATYNYDDYYLLQTEEGIALGWMHEGDLVISEFVPELEEPEEPTEPDEPTEPEEDDTDDGSDEDNQDSGDDSDEQADDDSDQGSDEDEPVEDTDDESGEDSEDTEDDSDEQEDEDSDQDSDEGEPVEDGSDDEEPEEDTDTPDVDSDEGEVTTEEDVAEVEEVYSILEDPATGVRIVSATDELEGKSAVVTVLNPSDVIDADHDLYDIQILNEDGSLYSLENPVTVYLLANGFVSNVYYLGDIGETLEAVDFTVEDGYVVFEVADFSQYAVVYGAAGEDNTTVAPVTEDATPVSGNKVTAAEETSTDHEGEFSAVETDTGEHPSVDTEEETVAADEADEHVEAAEQADAEKQKESESEMLPNTGVAEQSTTIFATILAALGLGFLVKRRKPTEK